MALSRIVNGALAVTSALTFGAALAPAIAQAASGKMQYGRQYLADVAPYNAAARNFALQVSSVGDISFSALQGAALPFIPALQNLNSKLQRQRWPTGVQPDINTLVGANGGVLNDLNAIETSSAVASATLKRKLSRDLRSTSSDARTVRRDLGLLPPRR